MVGARHLVNLRICIRQNDDCNSKSATISQCWPGCNCSCRHHNPHKVISASESRLASHQQRKYQNHRRGDNKDEYLLALNPPWIKLLVDLTFRENRRQAWSRSTGSGCCCSGRAPQRFLEHFVCIAWEMFSAGSDPNQSCPFPLNHIMKLILTCPQLVRTYVHQMRKHSKWTLVQ